MNRLIIMLSAFACFLPSWGAGEVLRTPSDARAWSQAFGSDRTLRWRWAEGATSARLTVSNLLTGAALVSEPVARGASPDAAFALDASVTGLVDVTLEQTDGANAVETCTARLRFCAPSETLSVDAASRDFCRVPEPRVMAWSPAWYGREATSASVTTFRDATRIGSWELDPNGGYAPLSPRVELGGGSGWRTASLAFDGESVAEANLLLPGGLFLFVK